MTVTDDSATIGADDVDEPVGGPALSWPRLIALICSFCFFGGAIAYVVTTPRPPGAGSVDAGFYLDMIYHHEQAVEMSLRELGSGSDPVIRNIAQEIVVFQQYEIGRMDEQLEQWGHGRRSDGDTAMAWMDEPTPLDEMPGLATGGQMAVLSDAKGADADRLFLELMAEHHRGGAHMATYAAKHADDRGVRELAARMAKNQAIEVNEFAELAERRGFDVEIPPYAPIPTEHDSHAG